MNNLIEKNKLRFVKEENKLDYNTVNSASIAKKEAYEKVVKKQNNELSKVYDAMRADTNKSFNCHDIDQILGSGTNIASRIFRTLEASGYIKNTGLTKSELNTSVTSYKVIDVDKELDMQAIKTAVKKTDELNNVLRLLNKISSNMCQIDLTSFDSKILTKIAAQRMYAEKAIAGGYTRCTNLFGENESVDVNEVLNYLVILTTRKV